MVISHDAKRGHADLCVSSCVMDERTKNAVVGISIKIKSTDTSYSSCVPIYLVAGLAMTLPVRGDCSGSDATVVWQHSPSLLGSEPPTTGLTLRSCGKVSNYCPSTLALATLKGSLSPGSWARVPAPVT